ncbi:delta-lactam-biosynthetic de-N-acetylase [Clostridium tepidum]|jgi:peptidoglycan-N-acetylmuramic acid deacetylase|uniref:Delta-lactam-biosynthetic de-N-acetylase n=1 Tax=Clostridium tepidum TaxID=1962263 RepID=A0A1S9I366_9CLOT|nr:delta-lactam-biosynthetic de-N-acetylase [Clostridium tepidum]MCR1935246.1 delta-lactam-biosynthetic de-N-acetylase [Clostridium tepidum]MDU6878634.1 delta-lactam-biosynthetic de-N-acetylase [Clostridium botulinum]OOO61932.1 delta-lactam-biosynthetic de-N-acetylase [Clostridium tepidum]OOO64739.1 delta-lactam-biosynthetic de-N-acetylase [Clostridium tepidum]
MNKKIISCILASSFLLCSCNLNASNKNFNAQLAENTTKTKENNIKNKSLHTEKNNKNNNKDIKKDTSTSSNINKFKDESNISSKEKDWFFKPSKNNEPATIPEDMENDLNKYSGYFLGDTSKKYLYLTFDEGYENGYTDKILDVLKANNVKAAFFVTAPYIKQNKNLIKRMVDEGHLVCNHSNNHPSMASTALKGKASFEKEFTVVENLYKDITNKNMPKFFRPPMGKYSELSLKYTEDLGYKTIFWSFAYFDWDKNKQPSPEQGKKKILNGVHNGSIILLHAVSKTNTEILDSVLKELKNNGYEFKTLEDLPEK